MRPPDENQPGSRRPNLISSTRRAAATDDSILARIERDASRKSGGGVRLVLWIGAGATVFLLIGALAWLTRENGRVPKTELQPGPALTAPEAIARVADAAMPAPPPPPRMLAATIVDEAPDSQRVSADPLAVPPPLVKRAPARTAPAHDKPAKVPAKAAAPAPRAADSFTAATPRAAARTAPPRSRKLPAPAESDAAPADSDVALISAIIIHSSAHDAERAQADAETDTAPAHRKPARRNTPAAPKTTD